MIENVFRSPQKPAAAARPTVTLPLTKTNRAEKTNAIMNLTNAPSPRRSDPSLHNSITPPPRAPSADVAFAAFALLEKLESGRRRPPPSISKVFRLYCIDLLSAAQVARKCRCSKAAVIRRLNFIRHKTGLRLAHLQVDYPPPGFIGGLPAGAPSFSLNGNNYLYAGTPDDAFAE